MNGFDGVKVCDGLGGELARGAEVFGCCGRWGRRGPIMCDREGRICSLSRGGEEK